MLEYFSVKGFKNFSNTFYLDFSDTRDYSFNKCCITNDLLSKIIIYGKNSVGKSNFGLALFDIVSHITDNNSKPDLYNYYLCADQETEYAEFHYRFNFDGSILNYWYKKDGSRKLIYEKLCLDKKLIFDVTPDNRDFSGLNLITDTLNLDGKTIDSYLRYIINNTALSDDSPLKKLMKFVSGMLWFRSLDQNRYIGYQNNSSNYYEFIYDEANLKEFQQMLYASGVNENIGVKTENDGTKALYFVKKGQALPFFKTASNGTKVLYTFFYWYKTAAKASLIFIDEFDAFYHHELSETIINIIEKMSDTQVILTSHNTNLFSNKIMRPDCYFILTENTLVSAANATNRELREGHNLEKLYKSGEFNV